MDLTHISTNLVARDKLLIQIEDEIKRKEKYLINKSKELEQTSKINSFLQEVQTDYHKYSDAILDEKDKQKKAMEMLNSYVNDVIESSKDIDGKVEEAKRDQNEIFHEIEKIKKELDGLVA